MMLKRMLPSARVSSTPVTVMVWGTFQFCGVNVTEDGETMPSVVSLLVRAIVTLAVGAVSRTIVNVSGSRNSEAIRPSTGSTVMPGVSLSRFLTLTSAGGGVGSTVSVEGGERRADGCGEW